MISISIRNKSTNRDKYMRIRKVLDLMPDVNEKLRELSAKRKLENNPIRSQQDIVADLITTAHKKEVK